MNNRNKQNRRPNSNQKQVRRNSPQNPPKNKNNTSAKKPSERQQVKNTRKKISQEMQRAEINRKMKSQTPTNRKNARAKKTIDPQTLEIRRRKIEKYKFYRKQRRRNLFKLFVNRFLMFVFLSVIIFLLSTGVFFLNLFAHDDVTSLNYTYQIGTDDDKSKTTKSVSYNELFYNNTPYVNMTEIASLYNFVITGDIDSIRFIINDDIQNNVKFYLNSTETYINGSPVRLSGFIYEENDNIYVPIDFFSKYVTGIDVRYDPELKKLIINRTKINSETEFDKIEFGFIKDDPNDSIDEFSLDYDILLATDPDAPPAEQSAEPNV